MTGQFSGEDIDKTREDLLQKLMEQMVLTVKQIHRNVSPRDSSLTPPQARLLFIISRKKDEGISVKDLAEEACVTSGAITQFVDSLVEMGLVRRDEDPNDRRIVRLNLTDKAMDQIEGLRKNFVSAAIHSFSVLNNNEIRELIALLGKVGT